jgi:hypothetical protein
VTVALISNNDNVPDIDVCNGALLAAGHTCLMTAYLPDDSYVTCKVTAGNVTKLRGTLELSEVPGQIFKPFMAVDLQ